MTRARAAPDADFKRCCMLSGEFDGSDRDYFFQVARFRSARREFLGVRSRNAPVLPLPFGLSIAAAHNERL